jgi:hypothetical protein
VPFISSFIYFIYGPEADLDILIAFSNSLFLTILSLSLFFLSAQIFNRNVAILSSIGITSFWAISYHFRMFMLDLPVTAMVCLGIYSFLKTKNFENIKNSIIFGFISGLGMLTKWSYIFFIFVPCLHSIISFIFANNKYKRIIGMILSLLMFLIITSPWYALHISNLLVDFVIVSYEIGIREGDPEVFSLQSLLFYIVKFPSLILFHWLIYFIIGFYFYLFKELKNKPILFLWMLSGYLILTVLRNKEIRYIMPVLPAVSMISVFWLDKIKWNFYRKVMIILIPVLLSLMHSIYADLPLKEKWFVPEAVNFIKSQKFYNYYPSVRVVPDHPYFEKNAFRYYAEINNFKCYFSSWHLFPFFSDYIITKTGYQGIRKEAEEIMNKHIRNRKDFKLIFKNKWQKNLPDGSVAIIYIRDITPLPKATPLHIIKKFRRILASYIQKHTNSVENLRIRIIPFSREDTLKGRLRKVEIYAKSVSILIQNNKNKSLKIENVRMEFYDLTINPYKLMREDALEIISLKKIKPFFILQEKDVSNLLSNFSAKYLITLAFNKDFIFIHFCNKVFHLCMDAKIGIKIMSNNFYYHFEEFRIMEAPLPSFIPALLTERYNPILNPMPFRMELNSISIADKVLSVNY